MNNKYNLDDYHVYGNRVYKYDYDEEDKKVLKNIRNLKITSTCLALVAFSPLGAYFANPSYEMPLCIASTGLFLASASTYIYSSIKEDKINQKCRKELTRF